jgi:D-tagatose-1,6-bisphosphate aldolase subunit GatZ/KbaZ
MRFFLGPMSKLIVDTVIDYSNEYKIPFTFIPSRRQIDKNSGYVNGWRTSSFSKYVSEKSQGLIEIERDHGGPGQGDVDDDGLESLLEDLMHFHIIHIDPWKKYPLYADGLEWTVKLINLSHSLNPNVEFEVGTEEGIRGFSVERLEIFLSDLKRLLSPDTFQKIRYIVIQCGTQLKEKENIGKFDTEKLDAMLSLAKQYKLIAKEHNGDWVSQTVLEKKKNAGLTCVNIAPELGEIETKTILKYIKNSKTDFEALYSICYHSGRWKKWVTSDFDPEMDKEKLILICGHYVFSSPEFLQLLTKYKNFDIEKKVKEAIWNKLHMLQGVYRPREECLMCGDKGFDTYFNHDYSSSLTFQFSSSDEKAYKIPFNILSCHQCNTVQTKYIGDLHMIYGKNHVDAFGSTKQSMLDSFGSFVSSNSKISGIIEVGTPTSDLANNILEKISTGYTIVEPDFVGVADSIQVIKNFIEGVDLDTVKGNTLLMSHIFEHLYSPTTVLKKLKESKLQYIYLNHPNFEYYCKNDVYNILNIEHISYFEESFLVSLYSQYGFELQRRESYGSHSTFLEFVRKDVVSEPNLALIKNNSSVVDTKEYFHGMFRRINALNTLLKDSTREVYLWPASAHNIALLTMGLHYDLLKGFLDNSPGKINKRLVGYNIPCYNYQEMINSDNTAVTIVIGCSGSYTKELDFSTKKVTILHLESL